MTRTRYKAVESEYPIFATCTCIDWFPLLKPDTTKLIIINTILNIQKRENFKVFAYVIMHNHFHIIYSSENPVKDIALLKSFSARQIIRYYQENNEEGIVYQMKIANPKYRKTKTHRFWQEGYHPKQMYSLDVLQQKIDYVHLNPVRSDYVDNPAEWPWSSASDDSIISISLLDY